MADKREKTEKFYTPEEVARAILKRTHELIVDFKKSNSSHEIEAGGEPSNDEAEAPEYLANADIENSGAHGEKTKKAKGAGIESADKDGDGDIDGDDAIEAQEEASGEDLDGDGEAGEKPEHKAKIAAAAKEAPKASDDKDPKATIKAATEEKPAAEAKDKKPPFAKFENGVVEKSEKGVHPIPKDSEGRAYGTNPGRSSAGAALITGQKEKAKEKHKQVLDESKKMPKPNLPKSEGKEPSLKKFMLARKMKKAGVPTADARAGEKMSGATPAPTPAAKIKEQPKLEMEKNKSVEKLMGIAPKAGK